MSNINHEEYVILTGDKFYVEGVLFRGSGMVKSVEASYSKDNALRFYKREHAQTIVDLIGQGRVKGDKRMNQDRIPILKTDPLADKIEERNNESGKEHDPIKPSHYRKGEIDLYESWYRTYPFNEFRAGMQMIAERYMKRDKNNRIEDLEKATYTIKRLKEYEELEKSDIEQALDDLKNGNINTFDSVEDLMSKLEEEQ